MNAIVAHKPNMPVATKYRAILSRDFSGDAPVIADNDALIPADHCRAIVAEMDAALMRCSLDMATEYTALIIGSYGVQKPDSPDAYVRMVAAAVCACPPDLLVKLVETVTARHPRFLPTKGEIDAVVNELTKPRGNARQWALKHLWRHKQTNTADDASKRHADWVARQSPETLARMEEIRAARENGASAAELIGDIQCKEMPK